MYSVFNGEKSPSSWFLISSPMAVTVLETMNDKDDDIFICPRFYYFIWRSGLIHDDAIKHFSASGDTSHQPDFCRTFQQTTEYYIRSVAQPPPSLFPRADGVALSHRGSWWGGGSSTHPWLFSKITEGSRYTFNWQSPCLHHKPADVVRYASSVFYFFSFLKSGWAGFFFPALWYRSRGEGWMCGIMDFSSFSL